MNIKLVKVSMGEHMRLAQKALDKATSDIERFYGDNSNNPDLPARRHLLMTPDALDCIISHCRSAKRQAQAIIPNER